MKKSILFSILLLSLSVSLNSQSDCKVKLEALSGTYVGKCKGGLADGKGLSIGKDKYKGKFKDGLPHGKGTYTYSDGSVYKGEFVEGRREGRGNYEFTVNGEKKRKEGYWENDSYIGPQKIKPYKVKTRRNIDRYTINRLGEGDVIRIFLNQNGRTNATVDNIMITGSSGDEMNVGYNLSYRNVEFPWTCRIRYTSQNKLQTASTEVVFVFEIIKPGNWNVTLHN